MRYRFFPLACVCWALLSVTGLSAQSAAPPVNVASFANPDLPNGKIAQGSMFEVFGNGIAAAGLNLAGDFPLPTELAGSSVRVTINGQALDCFVVRTLNNDRVAAILPSDAPTGSGTLTVSYNGVPTSPVPIEVVPHSFGVFTLNSAGSGPAVMTDANTFAVNTILGSFQPGAIVDVWGTGLGAAPFPDSGAPQVVDLDYDVDVSVGGQDARVFYAGRSGCCAGVDIVRFEVPQGVSGCHVPVQVTANNAPSNSVTMSISPSGGTCSDETGLSSNAIAAAEANGSAAVGDLNLNRISISFDGPPAQTFELNTDSASAFFTRYSLDQLLRFRGLVDVTTEGACLAIQFVGDEPVTEDPLFDQTVGLEAGTISLSGPNGTQNLTRVGVGEYSETFTSGLPGIPGFPLKAEQVVKGQFSSGFLGPGDYTFTGSGGSDVGPFTAQITVPQRPQTNLDSISSVDRSRSLRLTYSGAPTADYVQAMGVSITNAESETNAAGTIFFCRGSAASGVIDVPQRILGLMPVSDTIEGVPTGFLGIGVGSFATFSASGLDQGVVSQLDMEQKTVAYQ